MQCRKGNSVLGTKTGMESGRKSILTQHWGHAGELEKGLRSSRMIKDRAAWEGFSSWRGFPSKWTPGSPRRARGSGAGQGCLFYPGINRHQTNSRAAAQNKHELSRGNLRRTLSLSHGLHRQISGRASHEALLSTARDPSGPWTGAPHTQHSSGCSVQQTAPVCALLERSGTAGTQRGEARSRPWQRSLCNAPHVIPLE